MSLLYKQVSALYSAVKRRDRGSESAEAEIRHVFGDIPITEASIGAAPPDILVKLSGQLWRPYAWNFRLC